MIPIRGTMQRGIARLVLVALAVVVAACTPRPAERQVENGEAAVRPVPVDMDQAELARVGGVAVGETDAPVVLYEFSDFQCPACAQFAASAAPYIKQQYVQTGVVRYVRYDFPLVSIHPHAFLAARAGRCANEQGRFWEYHDLLYAEQGNWRAEENAIPLYVRYAEQVGLNRSQFESCLRSDRYAVEVTQNMMLGESLGVPGTPTLFINGRRAQIRTMEDLDRLIRQEAGLPTGGE